jgi:hypothetical protein
MSIDATALLSTAISAAINGGTIYLVTRLLAHGMDKIGKKNNKEKRED